jgi:hypothetical protein
MAQAVQRLRSSVKPQIQTPVPPKKKKKKVNPSKGGAFGK